MPVQVPKIGWGEDVGDHRVYGGTVPSKYITCRLKAHAWALGHAKRLTIAVAR